MREVIRLAKIEDDPQYAKFAWTKDNVPVFQIPQCASCSNNYYDAEANMVRCKVHFVRPGIYTTNSKICPSHILMRK